jgi:hypothetical protein
MSRFRRIQLLCSLVVLLSAFGFSANPTFSIKTIAAPGAGGPIVTADFDSDGNADLAVGTSKGLTVFYGDGTGNFTRVDVGGSTAFLQVADVDGDGRPDLISAQGTFPAVSIVTFRNNGDRTFAQRDSGPISGWNGTGFAAADFDGDGKADVALSTGQLTVGVAVGNGDGTFQAPRTVFTATAPPDTGAGPSGIDSVQVAGDFDGNGKPDFMVSVGPTNLFGGDNISFLLNQGHLTFTPETFSQGGFFQAKALEANGDGKTDVGFSWAACHTPCGGGDVWSLGTGKPQQIDAAQWDDAFGLIPQSPIAADFNGDGQPDIAWSYGTYMSFDALGTPSAPHQSIAIHLGPAQLSPADPLEVQVGPDDHSNFDAMVAGDFNGDGAPDIAVVSIGAGSIRVLLNTTPGVVKPSFRFALSQATETVAAGQSATNTATLTPAGGFTQSVAFTCSGLPTGAACSFTPSSLVPSNGPVKTTLTISTTARTSSSLNGSPLHRGASATFFAFTLPFFGIVCLGGSTAARDGGGRHHWKRMLLLASLCAVLALTLVGCGGFSQSATATPPPSNPGGSGSPTPAAGTPAGTYTVVVTAQGGGLTHTANVSLVVH